jgi:hypothetical protein
MSRVAEGQMFRLLLFPFFLPFLLLRVLIKTTLALVMLPFVLLVAGIGVAFAIVAASVAILLPLAPFALVGFCVWLLFRHISRPVVHPLV